MTEDIGRALEGAAKIVVAIIVISVPLALWKTVEIVIWLWNNIDISFK